MSLTYTVLASTPHDLQTELVEWLSMKRNDALRKANVKNQSRRTAHEWYTRATVAGEVMLFIKNLNIQPKPQGTT